MTLFSEATRHPAARPAGDGLLPSQGGHRPLHEPVLQSADESVAGEPLMGSALDATGHRTTTGQDPDKQQSWLTSMQDEVAQYAALEPLKATLMAVAAGALLALLAGRATRRSRKSLHRSSRR